MMLITSLPSPKLPRKHSAVGEPASLAMSASINRMRHVSRVAVLVGVCAICSGCGQHRPPVRGDVTFDGQPVENGSIVFEPTDNNGPSTGGKIIGGKYELAGEAAPYPGKKAVRIFASRKTGRQIKDAIAGVIDETKPFIPDIYNYHSTLSCEVGDDLPRQIDFHLKSK